MRPRQPSSASSCRVVAVGGRAKRDQLGHDGAHMECLECGATVSPQAKACPSCAAPLAGAYDDDPATGLRASADPPTEVLPAVVAAALPAGVDEASGIPGRGVLAP